jgi:hypothetical protein
VNITEQIVYNLFVRTPGELKSCTCPDFKNGDACVEYYRLGSCHNPNFERTLVSNEDAESDARKLGM